MNEFARYTARQGSYLYHYILKWQLLSQDIINKVSKIRVAAFIGVENVGYITWTRGSATIAGTSFNLQKTYYRGETQVYSIDMQIQHDSQGNASKTITGTISTTYMMNGSCTGTINPPKIDSNPPTVSLKLVSDNETSAVFNWSASNATDALEGRLNNGQWAPISGNTFTIYNLKEDTDYTYQIRAKRSSNQVWGESNIIDFKTLSGNFAEVSVNGQSFKKAEVYIITETFEKKISKSEYQTLIGSDSQ